MSDVTQILSRIESGDPDATEQLLPLVYEELGKLAAHRLAHEKPGQTLQATPTINFVCFLLASHLVAVLYFAPRDGCRISYPSTEVGQ